MTGECNVLLLLTGHWIHRARNFTVFYPYLKLLKFSGARPKTIATVQTMNGRRATTIATPTIGRGAIA